MATPVTKTIGSGQDYATLNAAKTANYGASGVDLTSVDEVVTNTVSAAGNFLSGALDQNGLTTDATRFLTVDCAPGVKHNGIYPSDMDFSGIGYGLVETDATFLMQDEYTVLRDLLLVQRPAPGSYVTCLYITAPNCLIENCILVGDSRNRATAEQYGIQWNFASGTTTVRNSVIICYDDDLASIRYGVFQGPTTGGVLVLENCTILTSDKGAYIRANGGLVLKNTVVRGYPASTAPSGGYDINNVSLLGGASTHNAYRDAGAQVDLTDVSDSALFVDPAEFDFRLRLGSILRGAGTDLATCPEDIVGTERLSGLYDIGAFQGTALDSGRRFWRVSLPESATNVTEGARRVVVEAETSEAALSAAGARYDGDSQWTEVEEITAAADYAGTEFRVEVVGVCRVRYTGEAGDSIDDVGGALAAALNATDSIEAAAYSSGTQILTIADTTDGLGDKSVGVAIVPAGAKSTVSTDTGPVGAITDKGSSGDALTVQLYAIAVPRVVSEG